MTTKQTLRQETSNMPDNSTPSSLEHSPVPASVPAEFPEILRELNRAILRAQPSDIIGFCADYFTKKKAEGATGIIKYQMFLRLY